MWPWSPWSCLNSDKYLRNDFIVKTTNNYRLRPKYIMGRPISLSHNEFYTIGDLQWDLSHLENALRLSHRSEYLFVYDK